MSTHDLPALEPVSRGQCCGVLDAVYVPAIRTEHGMPYMQVVACLLQSTQASSNEEAKELLHLLSATASEWLTLQPARQKGAAAVVRINRRADIKTIRRRLQDMAGRRKSMGGCTVPT